MCRRRFVYHLGNNGNEIRDHIVRLTMWVKNQTSIKMNSEKPERF